MAAPLGQAPGSGAAAAAARGAGGAPDRASGPPEARLIRTVARYAIYGEIAAGGMASVHLGRLRGAAGFARIVALKRLHPQYAKDPSFVAMFTDEARLAARIRHPNVVPTLDVVSEDGELFLVMEYVHGETLGKLIARTRRAGAHVPPAVAAAIVHGALYGLHAAHEATSERGEPLDIVHRDVSPQNILVGADGVARVLDFGIAKAAGRAHTTQDGTVKGKVGYMPPEQLYGERLDRRTDVYAAGVVLWESLVGERLFAGHGGDPAIAKALSARVDPPSLRVPGLPAALDEVVLRAVERERESRFASALEMAQALERAIAPALPAEVAAWVTAYARETIEARAGLIAALEQMPERESLMEGPPPSGAFSGSTAVTAVTAATAVMEPVAPGVPGAPGALGMLGQDGRAEIDARATTPLEGTRRRRALVVAGALLATLIGAAAGAALLLNNRSGGSGEASLEEPRAASPSPVSEGARAPASASAEAPAAGDPKPAEPPEVTPGGPALTATASATPSAAPTARTGSTVSPARRAPSAAATATAAPAAPPPKPASCDPPYTIDANGHKRYKRECLH